MDNLLTVAFEAHNPEKNHHRRYQITIGRDLLDDWTVAIRYGRTGQSGQRSGSPAQSLKKCDRSSASDSADACRPPGGSGAPTA